MLGLGDKGHEATDSDISRAYKKMALKYHPDKLGDEITQKDKEHWLKLQNAYETLSDPLKKRKYDSSLPFDDSIPNEDDVTEANFFDKLTRVFNRNAMWSKRKPIPDLGNLDTPMAEVRKFYKFWDTFESWREFSQYDEYDVSEASDRYERRYMEAENKRARKQHEKAERARLIKLVGLAYKLDPRIRKEQQLIEEEKQRKKQERRELKQREFDQQQAILRAEQDKKDAAERERLETLQAEAEARKQKDLEYKEGVKMLLQVCKDSFPDGTRFDKFWAESIAKQFNSIDHISEIR